MDCGLSRSDLISLRWVEVDFTTRILTKRRNKTGVVAVVPLTKRALAALLEVRNRAVVHREFVFTTQSGDLYSPTSLRRYFSRAKALAKLTGRFRLHDLRHSFITRAANSPEVGPWTTQRMAGHANIATTQGYVGPISAEAMEQARRALEG